MTEPLLKKRKGIATPHLDVVREAVQKESLVFVTQHPKDPALLNLSEFAYGASAPKGTAGSDRWKGGFNGRPNLIHDLFPSIRSIYRPAPKSTAKFLEGVLRAWWRLLDKFHDVAPVDRLTDITDIHGALCMREGLSPDYSYIFLSIVNGARYELELPPLYWPKREREVSHVNLPAEVDVKHVYHELKRRAYSILDRFSEADSRTSSNANAANGILGDESVHAAYRRAASRLGHPCPDAALLVKSLGAQCARELGPTAVPIYGLYPSGADIRVFFMLFLLRTGWNAQTALNIDLTTEYVLPHPTSSAHHIVRSVKARGNTEQVAIGLEKSQLSPGNLLRALVARTEPLRKQLAVDLSLAEARWRRAPDDKSLHLEVARLRADLKSPWLHCQVTRGNHISALHAKNYNNGSDKSSALAELIDELNRRLPDQRAVDRTMALSDFRDAYIAFAYQRSGYSWLVAKLAAGHSSIESLKAYLRNRQLKAYGEQKVATFQEAVWSEIRVHRIVDAAVLHALVQRGAVSDEQRLRWLQHKDRTHVGVGCRDFKNPPKSISPEHVKGTGCRVQRCTLCHHAVLFDDSVDHLARRLAELFSLKTVIPLATWHETSFPLEVDATIEALRAFDERAVNSRVSYWAGEIEAGRHVVLQMEGSYA